MIMRSIALVLTALLGAPGVSHGATQASPVTAFEHVTVIPMDRERVLTDQTVLVQGGRIAALGPAARLRVPDGATRIDGRGKFLLPGLGNMHWHLSADAARLPGQLLAALARGVTTLRSPNAGPYEVRLREQVAQGTVLGPRLYVGLKLNPASSEEAVREVTKAQANGYDFIKMYLYGAKEFDSTVATAKRIGIPVTGHADPGLERALQVPYLLIDHLQAYLGYLHSLQKPSASAIERAGVFDSAIVAAAAATQRAGTWVCPTLAVWEAFPRPKRFYEDRQPDDAADLSLNLVKALHQAGVGLLLGTDGVPGGSVKLGRELELLVTAGLTPYQALETGTRNVAAFFGALDSTGTVAVGKRADLVLLPGNPLTDRGHVDRPAGVMLGDRWFSAEELARRVAESR